MEIDSWKIEDRHGIVEVVDKRDVDDLLELLDKKTNEIELLRKRVKFLESDAIIQLEKKLEEKQKTASVVYKWLGQFAEHETLGKAWCGWLDDSYGAVYRIWKE